MNFKNINNKTETPEDMLQTEEEEEEETTPSSDMLSSDDSEDMNWISWFCSLKGNEFFSEVEVEYIRDDFNLTGLANQVQNYEYAIDMILDNDMSQLNDEQIQIVQSAAELLYGLIHARFILSSRGLQHMASKFQQVEFGRCPRVYCQGQPVLPVGQSDVPRQNTVKLFCPKCQDLYYPQSQRHANIDGAFFSTTFPHLLFQTYPELVPSKPTAAYVPRIYGFKIHKSSLNWPQPPKEKKDNNNINNNNNNNTQPRKKN